MFIYIFLADINWPNWNINFLARLPENIPDSVHDMLENNFYLRIFLVTGIIASIRSFPGSWNSDHKSKNILQKK
jgi:hypothetical protein